ncbi:MAG: hypothetical protein AB7G17_13235 [Phycisphaerales bacterium]
MTKAVVGLDRAPSAEVERRLARCNACEHAVPCARDASRACRCSVCRCVLSLKTRIAGERCPLERW